MDQNIKGVSRRSFLTTTGTVIGGLVAGSTLGLGIKKAEAATPAVLPFGWTNVDIETVRTNGFNSYFSSGGCMIGAAKALIDAQVAAGNTNFNNFPVDVFKWGAAGGLGWGTICGALNGACAVSYMALYNPAGGAVNTRLSEAIDWMMKWYSYTSLPTNTLKTIADAKATEVGATHIETQTMANSPLCHNSVSQWCRETNSDINGYPKKIRCAKLTGDVAAFMANLLNQIAADPNTPLVDGTPYDNWTADCMDCHTGAGTSSTANGSITKFDNDQGKMICVECHDNGVAPKNISPACPDPLANGLK